MNELRDPHDPVIPGEHVHPPEGHGGVSMPIGVSGDKSDPHEPVLPEGMKQSKVAHIEDHPPQVPLDEQLAEEEVKTKDSDDDGNEAG